MDALSTLQVVIRRWRVVVPVLLGTALIAVALVLSVASEYTSTMSLIVVSDERPAAGLAVDARILAEAVQDGQVRRKVATVGGSSNYFAEAMTEDIVRITAEADSEKAAVATVSAALDQLTPLLDAQYERRDIAEGQRSTIDAVNRPRSARTIGGQGGGSAFRAEGSATLVLQSAADDGSQSLTGGAAYLLLWETMQSPGFLSAVHEAGGSAPFEITTVPTNESPAPLRVTATGTDPDTVLATLDTVIVEANRELQRFSELIDEEGAAVRRAEVLVPASEPLLASRGLIRSLAVIVFLGVALATGLALLVERWSAIRAALTASPDPAATTRRLHAPDGEVEHAESFERIGTAAGGNGSPRNVRSLPRRGYGRTPPPS